MMLVSSRSSTHLAQFLSILNAIDVFEVVFLRFRYYGYRNPNSIDPRLEALNTRKELFKNKDVLDIGCNIGHITYCVARDFYPKSVLGIDLDNLLITIARKNLQHYAESHVENMLINFNIDTVTPPVSTFPDNVSFKHVSSRQQRILFYLFLQ